MKIFRILVFIAVVYLLYWMFGQIGLDFNAILSNLLRINPLILGAAVGVNFASYLMMNLRWKIILDRIVKVGFFRLLPYTFMGQFVSAITPSARTGGEPVRAYFLSKKTGVGKSKILATIILDKFLNAIVFVGVLLAVLAYTILFVSLPRIFDLFFEITFLIVLFAIIFVFVFRKSLKLIYFEWILVLMHKLWFIRKKWKEYEEFKEYTVSRAKDFYHVFNESLDNKKIMWKGIVISFIMWALCYATIYLLFLSFNCDVSAISMMIAYTLSIFFGDISFLPGGIAIAEGVAVVMYLFLRVNLLAAISVVIVDRLIYYLMSIIIGGPIFFYYHFKDK